MKTGLQIVNFSFFKSLAFLILVLLCTYAYPQSVPKYSETSTVISLNDNWQFTTDPQGSSFPPSGKALHWTSVSFPHSWNTTDVMDDEPGYYRGAGWYRKKIVVGDQLRNKKLFLYFDGANQLTEVWVNGKKAGKHTGGYTRFCIPVSDYLKSDNKDNVNEVVIRVDNSHNENIPPLSADFTFFGGVYRNVYLVAKDPVYFDMTDYASTGVYITTPSVTEGQALVAVRARLQNTHPGSRRVRVKNLVTDHSGAVIVQEQTVVRLKSDEKAEITQQLKPVKNPRLWSPDDPYLYRVISRIYDAATNELLDEVVNPLGLRWFRFDAQNGFFLNGKPLKLIGTSRHQDFKDLGNALPSEFHIRDMELLKEMGGNFLRVAHYPQDPRVLETCDRLGILASVEIPIVNAITESEEFYHNCREMQKEMIRQNYNHPSVVLWAYMNEVLLRPKFAGDTQRQQEYFKNITKLTQELEDLTRAEDPSRYTFISNHGAYDNYKKIGLTTIPMVIGWNLYQGWYSDNIDGFAGFLDRFHKENPDKPLMVTEYGADADPRLRTFSPLRFDKTVEYAAFYHETYLKEIMQRPFVVAAMAWNLADFNSEQREETMPHINNKGLLTWDRKPKDTWYLYQASLLKRPFIRIASRDWTRRGGVAAAESDTVCYQPLKIYTNLKETRLLVNGKDLGAKSVNNVMSEWSVPFKNGWNTIEAVSLANGQVYKDYTEIHFDLQPYNLNSEAVPFTAINILLGAKRYFIDETRQLTWIPAQSYRKGSWGYTGGEPFRLNNGNKDSYGTGRNIHATFDDPLYQTQQTGIKEFRLDVPDGYYEIVMYFAELTGGEAKAPLPYDLTDDIPEAQQEAARLFNVWINDAVVLRNFSPAQEAGVHHGTVRSAKVFANGGKGIHIRFEALKGEPILNALQVRKIF